MLGLARLAAEAVGLTLVAYLLHDRMGRRNKNKNRRARTSNSIPPPPPPSPNASRADDELIPGEEARTSLNSSSGGDRAIWRTHV